MSLRSLRREDTGLANHRGNSVTKLFTDPLADVYQGVNIYSGLVAHALKHVDEVFGGNVSGSPRCKRTSADTSDGGVDRSNTRLNGSVAIGESGVPGIMEMCAILRRRNPFHDGTEQIAHLAGHGTTNGVCQCNFGNLDFRAALDEIDNPFLRHFTLGRGTQTLWRS